MTTTLPSLKTAAHDIVIVGGGAAGLRAADGPRRGIGCPERPARVQGVPDAKLHRRGRGRCGSRLRKRRQPRAPRLRHDPRKRLSGGPGRRGGVRRRGAGRDHSGTSWTLRGALPPRWRGLPRPSSAGCASSISRRPAAGSGSPRSAASCRPRWSAGIYRTEESLEESARELRRLRECARDLSLDDRDQTFNTELVTALELENMLDVAEAVVRSALERRESRGAHTRTDHPARDDGRFGRHSLAFADVEGPRIEYGDVSITRWPPVERAY